MTDDTVVVKAEQEEAGGLPVSRAFLRERELFKTHLGIAKQLFDSGCYPDCKTQAQAFAKIQTGVDMGLSPSAAMRQIYIIPGKKDDDGKSGFTIALAADLMVGLVKRHGQARFSYERNLEKGSVTVHAERLDTGETFDTTWDRERIARTGISKSSKGIKHNYAAHEIEMMKHRGDTETCRALWPDVVGGLYCIEEAQEIVEAEWTEMPPPPSRTAGIKQLLGVKGKDYDIPSSSTPVVAPETFPGGGFDVSTEIIGIVTREQVPEGDAGAAPADSGGQSQADPPFQPQVAPEPAPRPVPENLAVELDKLYTRQRLVFDRAAAEVGAQGISIDDMTAAEQARLWEAIQVKLAQATGV